jgi:hypothetical protein
MAKLGDQSLAFAEDQLTTAYRAPFGVAAEYVQLALRDAAIRAGATVCSPVFLLLPVSDAIDQAASDFNLV